MKKRVFALFLSLFLCVSLLPAARAAGKTYAEAVQEFREEDSMREISQTFDSDYGTIFIYGSPNPHGATGSLRFITKAPCAKGEGETIGLPTPRHGIMCATKAPQTAVLSEDGKTFTYTYHYDEPLTVVQGPMLRPAGDFIYTLDLTTGEVTEDVPTIPEDYNTYAAALERVKSEEGWVIEQTLDAPACTVLLRYFQAGDGRRSYFLVLVWKIDNALVSPGGVASHDLTITRDDGTGEAGFPVYYTHRAPDTLTLSEDKALLTYTYSESLAGGPDSETLELATGLSSKTHTLPTIEPEEPQPPTATEFTDVPAGSWFEKGVATCVQEGVMVGTGEGRFSPDAELSVAECLTLALRLYDLQRGGDGTMEKVPEDWGKLTLTLNDGTVFQGYGEVYQPFAWSDGEEGGLYVSCQDHGATLQEQEAWGSARLGPATVSLGGRDIPGAMEMHMGASDFLLFFVPDDPGDNEAIKNTYCEDAPNPQKWYRDAAYTAKAWGLRDDEHPGFSGLLAWSGSNLDRPANREAFALALHDAAGKLEKKFTVETIHDIYYGEGHLLTREEDGGIFALYEAGVLGGVDEFGTFGGHQDLTRAEAATMVARVLDESQRLTKAPAASSGYDRAVAELRSGMGYDNERTFDTDLCTVFIFDLGGMMNAPSGWMKVVYKPGSALGDGHVLELPHVRSGLPITPADATELSADQKTFTYTYFYDTPAWDSSLQGNDTRVEPGTVTFTVDLPTGEIRREYRPLDYAGAMAHVTRKRIHQPLREHTRDREVVRTLETDLCTVVLTNGGFVCYDDYVLSLVYKPGSPLGEGTIKQLILPSTVYDKVHAWYKPTDRPPDSLEVSGDGKTLTYVYHFDQALVTGSGVYHEAGTYTYTVDLATGELNVTYTEN